MPFTPQTVVYLLNVPLEEDQKNQLDFASVSAQTTYFLGKQLHAYTDFTYQRKDGVIRVPAEIDSIYNCNYVMYQNSNFTGKWFYAFITKMEYINANMTALTIKTDVFQTWQFDFTFLQSFVAREHVAVDTPLLHTLPEPVSIGEPVSYSISPVTIDLSADTAAHFDNNYLIAVCMTEGFKYNGQVYETISLATANYFGGIPNASNYFAITAAGLGNFFTEISHNGQEAAVVAVYCVARNAITAVQLLTIGTANHPVYAIDDMSTSLSPVSIPTKINQSMMFSGDVPRNKKLLSYPYNYITLTNNNGSNVDLKLENFTNSDRSSYVYFATDYAPTANGSLCVFPKNYMQYASQVPTYFSEKSYNYAVEFNSFPQIAWLSDIYSNYIARNANSIEMQKINFGIRGAETFAQFGRNPASALTSSIDLAQSIMGYYASMDDMARQPDVIHGTPTGNLQMKSGSAGIYAHCKSLKTEYIILVDSYFDRYGYNVSLTKIPQYTSRPSWNYLETREVNLTGNIPQEDANELKNIFNSGLTVWHDPAHFGDYTRNNAPT